jgi:hypothetical protein
MSAERCGICADLIPGDVLATNGGVLECRNTMAGITACHGKFIKNKKLHADAGIGDLL